ncbi:hypothetical protein J007_04066 [Cryptococcus neoformans]|nr:hypothetical protein J007_04066 [Cryptococcus neoformans var. grubii]
MRTFGRWQQKKSSSSVNLEKRRGGRCWNSSFEKIQGCQHWDNQCTPPCGPTERVHGVASHELKSDGAHVEEGKEGGNGGYGSEDEEEFGQGRNVDSSARTGEEDEEDGEEDGK